jgi:ribA/ribD-fused uncharacterized protein
MYPISSEGLNKETDDAVYFFTTAYHPLDNFSAHALSLWGLDFPTAEHAFQWKKFSDNRKDISEAILNAKSPHLVKEISDANKSEQPSNWHDKKILVMEEILRAKAKQHKDVRDTLKKTGNRTIIENSPFDSFWGIGPDGKGQNMAGEIWMKIRDELNLSK